MKYSVNKECEGVLMRRNGRPFSAAQVGTFGGGTRRIKPIIVYRDPYCLDRTLHVTEVVVRSWLALRETSFRCMVCSLLLSTKRLKLLLSPLLARYVDHTYFPV